MKRKFIKAMAVGISAMMLMSSTLVYAEEGSEGGGEPAQSEESSSEESSGDNGSGEESSDNSGDSGESHEEGSSNESAPVEEPAAETPAAEQPAPETPVNETPASETPVTETPAAETPAEQPAAGTEATDSAAATDPTAMDPVTGEPVVTDPAAAGTVTEGTESAGDGTVTVPVDTPAESAAASESSEEEAEKESETETVEVDKSFFEQIADIGNETVLLMQKTVEKAVDDITGVTAEEEAAAAALNEPDENPTIEGGYIDWSGTELSAVAMPQHTDGTEYTNYGVNGVAWVQKGDYVYIYLEDQNNAATSAGYNSTGNYSINTDLGYKIVFKLNNDGTVTSNTDGITAVYQVDNNGNWFWNEETKQMEAPTGHWEIKVDKDAIPQNLGNISFGLYNTSNQGSDGYTPYTLEMGLTNSNTVTPFNDETNEQGYIDSWDGRGVVQLDYTTSGTHYGNADGFAGQYGNGDQIYGIATTTLPAHTDQGNYCVMEYKIYANDVVRQSWGGIADWESYYMMTRMVGVDAEGNMDWDTAGLVTKEDGVYEYHIFATDTGGNWATYSDYENALASMDSQYVPYNYDFGTALVTVKDGDVTVEWYIDAEKYASFIATKYPQSGVTSATDLKEVTTSYHRIGGEVTSAGASSGPVANAGMCLAACLMGLALNKKKLVNAVQKAKAEV
ncbi:MAG: hypothetical protein IJU93_09590 [Lachnospiraceae bacterium]|nr:hypothetical protein [Lachnospiraceae bacterium]